MTFHEIKKNEEVNELIAKGNAVNRSHHAEYGGLLANEILKESDMAMKDRIAIVSAISNHDESTGGAVDPISAALIIADKTDVRRDRVRIEKGAADMLGVTFKLVVNGSKVL